MSSKPLLLLPALVVALSNPNPARAQSGLQITPDGLRTLVNKDVGGERWAIVRGGFEVSGNVYLEDGSSPKFVACSEILQTATDITFACEGAGRCLQGPCSAEEWSAIGEATLPASFFEPADGSSSLASAASVATAAATAAGSGLQVLPDRSGTLVNKDVGDERWSIVRFADDGVVTGIAYVGESGESRFVWCEEMDVAGGNVSLRCSGADSCREGGCSPDQWQSLGDVVVPESFFLPPQREEIAPENVASLVLDWDFPLGSGVTAFPIVHEGLVIVGAWDGNLYALDADTGEPRWVFETNAGGTGIQSTVTLVEGGDLLFADFLTNVYRLDARTGDLRWQKLVADPAVDHVWSAVTVGGGRIFVGIASHSDNPCTNGRTIALDLESGETLWERENVPARVCRTDTSVVCDDSSDCPDAGECVRGRGAGVTASPAVSADGRFVYVNTVGCYTFPSIGDSDAMMKLDARNGDTIWLNRVEPPEQFGFCAGDPSIDCGRDSVCGAAGPCRTKALYHDFGFLNGPLIVESEDERGRPQTLLVSGSKHGTIYALRERDGEIAWKNVVVPTPVSPGFAAFGLFNGAVVHEQGCLFAALNNVSPPPNPAPPRVVAFDPDDGSMVWGVDAPPAWASVGVGQGVLFTGNNERSELAAYEAATGRFLAALPLPETTASRPAVDGSRLYVTYGIISGVGGIRAYRLP